MEQTVRTSANLALSVLNDGDTILADASGGAITITLPLAIEISKVTVRKTDTSANNVTIATKGVFDSVDGGASITVSKANNTAVLLSDGQTKFLSQGTDKYTVDYRRVTASGNILVSDSVIGVSGTASEIVVTLPATTTVPSGREYWIHGEASADGTTMVVSGAGSNKVDGVVAITLSQRTGSLSVYSDGTNWRSLASDKL